MTEPELMDLYIRDRITLDEYEERLRYCAKPKKGELTPKFMAIPKAQGTEKDFLKKLSDFPITDQVVTSKNIRVYSVSGGFAIIYKNIQSKKQISYPGRFENKLDAQKGVNYMVMALNNEINRRN